MSGIAVGACSVAHAAADAASPPPDWGPSGAYLLDGATGMAPGAKLAFYDIGDVDGNYELPGSYEDLLLQQLLAGAHVQSDSWGSYQ